MKGPLHGGAPSAVTDMLEGIGEKQHAESYIREKLEKGERLMGFGHRVYKTHDPRAKALRVKAEEIAGGDRDIDLALHVENTAIRLLEEYKPGRKLYTNVEFYAAAVMKAGGFPYLTVEDGDYLKNNELYIKHWYEGIELDLKYLEKVLPYLHQLWGRSVQVETVLEDKPVMFSYDGKAPSAPFC